MHSLPFIRCGLSVLLVFALTVTGAAAQATYYVAPDGDDDASGTSEDEALKTLNAGVDMLTTPGDELVLLNGTYTPEENGSIDLDDLIGTEANPYVIRAQNERRAWVQGDGVTAPVDIDDSSWLVMEGLRASARDSAKLDEDGDLDGEGSVIDIDRSRHVTFRRILTHHPNFYGNASVFGGSDNAYILVEESEAYDFHRHGISFGRSDQVTIRRSFVNAREADTSPGTGLYDGHACCYKAGDEGYSFYFSSNSIVENSVSMHTESVGIIGGVATALGNPGGQDNQVLGSISYKDLRPGGFLQSRRFINRAADRYGGYTGPADSVYYRDYLVIGGQTLDRGADLVWSVAKNVTMETSTFVNIGAGSNEGAAPINVSENLRGDPDDPDENRLFLNCEREELDGCTYRIRNTLFLDNEFNGEGGALLDIEPGEETLDLLVSYSNAYSSGIFSEAGFNASDDDDETDDEGRYRNNLGSMDPTGMGLGQGECIAFVPEGSSMYQAGADLDDDGTSEDVGANILYRYEDGELTDEPLWDAETGEFPHGAVIEGSPNDPDLHEVVAANIHEHLNVNANGCRLPYATGTPVEETGEVPTQLQLKQNYPNPFNPSTEIAFALPQSSPVTLAVYDVLGREVAKLMDGQRMTAGEYRIRFEAGELPSGLYMYRLEANGQRRVQKMMLVR